MTRRLGIVPRIIGAWLLLLTGSLAVSPLEARVPCPCPDIEPEWANYVVTSQGTPIDCDAKSSATPVGPAPVQGQPWQRDARWAAAVAMGRVPREMAGDERAMHILDKLKVVHETGTEAIVRTRAAGTDFRVCLSRMSTSDSWFAVRIDFVDLSRPIE